MSAEGGEHKRFHISVLTTTSIFWLKSELREWRPRYGKGSVHVTISASSESLQRIIPFLVSEMVAALFDRLKYFKIELLDINEEALQNFFESLFDKDTKILRRYTLVMRHANQLIA